MILQQRNAPVGQVADGQDRLFPLSSPTMVSELKPATRWLIRLILWAALAVGAALLISATTTDDAPRWWLFVGLTLVLIGGPLTLLGLHNMLRYPTPEARQQRLQELASQRAVLAERLEPGRIAHQATKYKKEVLRDGVNATALVTRLADGGRGNDTHQLVYLELAVESSADATYPVRTGEYLTAALSGSVTPGRRLAVKVDPRDPQRVAVDWDRSLRWPPPEPASEGL
jgi:hypothetical protein